MVQTRGQRVAGSGASGKTSSCFAVHRHFEFSLILKLPRKGTLELDTLIFSAARAGPASGPAGSPRARNRSSGSAGQSAGINPHEQQQEEEEEEDTTAAALSAPELLHLLQHVAQGEQWADAHLSKAFTA